MEEYIITSRQREKLTAKQIKEIENYNKQLGRIKMPLKFKDRICHAEISTERYFEEEDIYRGIYIVFKDGPLDGRSYKFDIPKEDLEEN